MKNKYVVIYEIEDLGDGDGGMDYGLFDRADEMLFFINDKKRLYGDRFRVWFACEYNTKIDFPENRESEYEIKL